MDHFDDAHGRSLQRESIVSYIEAAFLHASSPFGAEC